MRKRGRPRKHEEEKLHKRLDLRVSGAEKTAFRLAAENSQQDLSVWIRIQLHKAAAEELDEVRQQEAELSETADAKHS